MWTAMWIADGHRPRPRFQYSRFFTALIFFWSAASAAQTAPVAAADHPDSKWNCWVSVDWQPAAIYMIRCIRDREVPPPEPPLGSPAAALLDYAHDLINRGETLQLDNDLHAGHLKEVVAHIPRIRIYQYPYEESWSSRRPFLLVEGLLCPKTGPCTVKIQR